MASVSDPSPSKPGVVGSSPAGRAGFPVGEASGRGRKKSGSVGISPDRVPASARANKTNARPALNARSRCVEASGPLTNAGYVSRHDGLAHRVAFERVNGPIPDGMMVLHSCDNRRCINPAHLRLGTHDDNMRDRLDRGRTAKGERHGRAKLTDEQAEYIRRAPLSARALAEDFGVTKATIFAIRAGRIRGASKRATAAQAQRAREGMRALRAARRAHREVAS
jgi:hypothetical protein